MKYVNVHKNKSEKNTAVKFKYVAVLKKWKK